VLASTFYIQYIMAVNSFPAPVQKKKEMNSSPVLGFEFFTGQFFYNYFWVVLSMCYRSLYAYFALYQPIHILNFLFCRASFPPWFQNLCSCYLLYKCNCVVYGNGVATKQSSLHCARTYPHQLHEPHHLLRQPWRSRAIRATPGAISGICVALDVENSTGNGGLKRGSVLSPCAFCPTGARQRRRPFSPSTVFFSSPQPDVLPARRV
jgi:hypothetical protein